MKKQIKPYDEWHIHNEMVANGWEMIDGQNDGEDTYYKMTIVTHNNECSCVAIVSASPNDDISEWGVQWIDVYDEEVPVPKYSEDNTQYLSYEDLEIMQEAIERAEWNLVSLGIPFYEEKYFHGPKSKLMQKKNLQNRIRWGWSKPETKKNKKNAAEPAAAEIQQQQS